MSNFAREVIKEDLRLSGVDVLPEDLNDEENVREEI